MNILIIGSGAMGSLFAGKLQSSGNQVKIFNRWNDHVEQIRNNGLIIKDKDENSYNIEVPIITNPDDVTTQFDLVVVLVKTFATKSVLQQLIPKISHDIPILTLQNGIGNIEQIQEIAPNHDVFVGVTYAGASVETPGTILHRAWGSTIIGSSESGKHGTLLERIATCFSNSGLFTEVSNDVQSIIWNKLFTNIAYNGLTAITRLKNGDTLRQKEGISIITNLVQEAKLIAKAKGINLHHSNPVEECIRLGKEEIGLNTSSMLSDTLHQRKTEIDAINGRIVEEGKKLNIPTPYNEMMVHLIKVIESSYKRMVHLS